jgi:hypothetical protein
MELWSRKVTGRGARGVGHGSRGAGCGGRRADQGEVVVDKDPHIVVASEGELLPTGVAAPSSGTHRRHTHQRSVSENAAARCGTSCGWVVAAGRVWVRWRGGELT